MATSNDSYSKITDVIFAVLLGLSFRTHYALLMPFQISYKALVLLFTYSVMIYSRILYQRSIIDHPYLGTSRFIIDLWILYMYFSLSFSIENINQVTITKSIMSSIIGIFFGYTIWDLFKAQEYPDEIKWNRIGVTIVCLVFAVLLMMLYDTSFIDMPILTYGATQRNWLFILGELGIFTIFWKLKL